MRSIDPATLELLDEGRLGIRGMIRLDLGQGAYGVIMGNSDYTYGGVIYKALPRGVVEVSGTVLDAGTTASGLTVKIIADSLQGLTPDVLLSIENYDYRGRNITIFDMFTHPDTGAVVQILPKYEGYVNFINHDAQPSGDGFSTVFNCETEDIELSKTNARFRTTEDQKRRLGTNDADLFWTPAITAAQEKLDWGRK